MANFRFNNVATTMPQKKLGRAEKNTSSNNNVYPSDPSSIESAKQMGQQKGFDFLETSIGVRISRSCNMKKLTQLTSHLAKSNSMINWVCLVLPSAHLRVAPDFHHMHRTHAW